MKRKNTILALAMTLVLTLSSVQSAFANTIDNYLEYKTEDIAVKFTKEVQSGKYKIVDTKEMKLWVDRNDKMIIVDTMPGYSYEGTNGHIPGAINAYAPLTADSYPDKDKADLLNKVTSQLPYKTVTKTTWKKVKKATYKKLKKSNRKTKKIKGKRYYYKKVVTKSKVKDKSYKVVVYCGFVGCSRSHVAAAYLVSKGFTNVYRYGGGILAWTDAGYPVEGKVDETDSEVTVNAEVTAETSNAVESPAAQEFATESEDKPTEYTSSEEAEAVTEE